jgi:archaellum component FlaC
VTRTESSWFGLKKNSSTSTQFADVTGDLSAQFGLVFKSIGDALPGAAGELGRDGEAVAQQVAQFVVDIPRLSLKGLNGEEVQEAISNAISASADQAAKASVAGLDAFQRIGEGYFETVVRVAAGIESAGYELEQLGVAAVSFSSIANKQGDVAAEIVRQSIVAVETAGGALSNVGQIISNFDGDAAALADTFEALVDVRQALQLVGISGDALTVALIRAAGGLDELSSLLDDYHEDFYTAEERRAATLAEVSAGLAALGEVLPETRDGFRAIVERIGGKGDAGALAAVLRLADAFASVTPSADELARAASDAAKDAADAAEKAAKDRKKAAEDAARDAADAAEKGAAAQRRARKAFDDIAADMARGVADAFDAVRTQIEAEQDRINDEAQKQVDALDKRADDVRSAFEKIADAMGDLRESLQQTIDEISGELAGDEGRAAAREKLSAMLAASRAGATLDPEAVKRAAGIASKLTTDPFGTKADYLRDAARLQGTLRDLSAEADRQAQSAQAAMNAELQGIAEEVAGVKEKAEAQLKVLRQQLDEARTAASALASIDEGVHSVAGAIQALAGAMAATKALTSADGAVTGQWQQSGGGEVYRDAGGAVGVRKTGDTDAAGLSIRGKLTSFTAQEAIDWIDTQVSNGSALAVYNRARAEGLSLSTIDDLMAGKGWKPGTSAAWAAANSLPAFADGGRHAGGVRIVGERGPEIEVTGPSRIHTFDQLMTMAGGGRRDEALVAEVRKLRAELERMHSNTSAQQLAIAEHTSKAAAIFKRWEGDGMPPERT